MLQQTRVETVIAYWLKWMQRSLYPIFALSPNCTSISESLHGLDVCLHNHIYAFLFHDYLGFRPYNHSQRHDLYLLPTIHIFCLCLGHSFCLFFFFLLFFIYFFHRFFSARTEPCLPLISLIPSTIWIQASFDDVNTLWAGRAFASDPHISISISNPNPDPHPNPNLDPHFRIAGL
jgi:hypothetical protein